MTTDVLNNLYAVYKRNPKSFTEDEVVNLQNLMSQSGLQFERDSESSDFNLFNTVGQLVSGFVSGFTTVNANDLLGTQPSNPYERVAHSVGSLMGFIGYVPGPGLLGKLGAGAVGKAMGLHHLSKLPKGIKAKSAPMFFADKVLEGINKVTASNAAIDSVKFLQKGKLTRDLIEGGLHLGAASFAGGANPWELQIDQRMEAFMHGAELGVVSRGIGNVFARGGKFDVGKTFSPSRGKNEEFLKHQDIINATARAISSSLYMGLPTTAKDYPLELQVYEYIIGAYFGAKEMPAHRRRALEISRPFNTPLKRYQLLKPEKYIENYDKLPKNVQDELQLQADLELGGSMGEFSNTEYFLAKTVKDLQDSLRKDLDAGKITQSQYQQYFKDWTIAYEIQELKKQGVEDDVAIEKGKELAAEKLASDSKEQEQVLNLIRSLNEGRNINDLRLVDSLLEKEIELDNKYEQVGLSSMYRYPFEDMSRTIASMRNKPQSEGYADIEQYVVEAAKKYIGKKDVTENDYNEFVKDINTKFNQDLADTGKFDISETKAVQEGLRNAFVKVTQSEHRARYAINANGTLSELQPYDNTGKKRTKIFSPPSIFTRIVGDGAAEITYFQKGNKEKSIYDAVQEGEITLNDIVINAYNNGTISKTGENIPLMVYGGVKANDSILVGKALVTDPESIRSNLDAYAKHFGNDVLRKLFKDVDPAHHKIIEANVANNIEFLKRFNGMETAEQLFAAIRGESNLTPEQQQLGLFDKEAVKPHIIFDPVAFTKRAQMFNAREPRAFLSDEHKAKIKDAENGFRFVILDSNSKEINVPEFESNYTYKISDGEVRRYDAHRDGGVLLRADVYEQLARYFGYDPNTSSMKGTHVFTDPELAGFIGKLAWHKASDKSSAYMTEKGVHAFHFDTTAKQRGMRKSLSWEYKENNLKINDIENHVYKSNWEDITINAADDLHSAIGKRQPIPKPLVTLLDSSPEGLAAQEALYNKYYKNSLHGTPEINAQVKEILRLYEKGDIEIADKNTDTIEIDDLGVSDVLRILNTTTRKNKLYDKVVKEILNIDENDLSVYDDVIDRDSENYQKFMSESKGTAKRILSAINDITPQILNMPGMRQFFDQALLSYMQRKIVSPRVKYATKQTFMPHDPFEVADLGGVKEGFYYAASETRNIKMNTSLGEKTLGEAYDLYKEGKLSAAELEHLVIRTPTSSKSGVRILQFGGFLKIKGSGFYVHPKEYAYMDGADNDIDSAKMFFDMPQEVKSYFKKFRNSRETEDGRLLEAKNTPELLETSKDNPLGKLSTIPFDSRSLLEANYNAYIGNRILGPGMAEADRLLAIHDTISAGNKKFSFSFETKKKGTIEVSINPDKQRIEHLKSEIVNYSADSADGYKIKDSQAVRETLWNNFFKSIRIREGKVSRPATAEERKELYKDILRNLPGYNELTKVNQASKGRLTETRYYENEAAERVPYQYEKRLGTNEFFDVVGSYRNKFSVPHANLWYRNLHEMGNYGLANEGIGQWLGINTAPGRWMIGLTKYGEGKFDMNTVLKNNGRKELVTKNIFDKETRKRVEDEVEMNFNSIFGFPRVEGDATHDMMMKREVERRISDFAANDITDWAHAFNVDYYGREIDKVVVDKNGYTKNQIRKAVEDYRKRFFKLVASENKEIMLDGETEPYTVSRLENDILEFRKKITPLQKRYFSSLWISSLFQQHTSKKVFLSDITKQIKTIQDAVKDELKAYTENEPKTPDDFRKAIEFLRSKNPSSDKFSVQQYNDLIRKRADKSKEWYNTQTNNSLMNMSFVEPDVIRGYLNNFQKISDATYTKLNLDPATDATPGQTSTSIDEMLGGKIRVTSVANETFAKMDGVQTFLQRQEKILEQKAPSVYRSMKDLFTEFKDIVGKHPELLNGLEERFMYFTEKTEGIARTFETAVKSDIIAFKNYLKDVTMKDPKGLELKKRHWYFLPEKLAELHDKYDPRRFEKLSLAYTGSTIVPVHMRVPMSNFSGIIKMNHTKEVLIDREIAGISEKLFAPDSKFSMLRNNIEKTIPGSSDEIIKFTIAQRERGLGPKFEEYYQGLAPDFISKYQNKVWNIVDKDGVQRSYSTEDIVNSINREFTDLAKRAIKEHIYNPEAEASFLDDYSAKTRLPFLRTKTNWIDPERALSEIADTILQGKTIPKVGINAIDRIAHSYYAMMFRFPVGFDKTMSAMDIVVKDASGKVNRDQTFEKRVRFLETMSQKTKWVKEDGVWRQETYVDATGTRKPVLKYKWLRFKGITESLEKYSEVYFPHREFSKAESKAVMERKLEAVRENPSEYLRLKMQYERMIGEGDMLDQGMTEGYLNMLEKSKTKWTDNDMEQLGFFTASSHMKHRNPEDPMLTYSRNLDAWSNYEKSLVKTYWNKLNALLSHFKIDKFESTGANSVGKENVEPWVNFMKVYVRDSLGYPSLIPQQWFNDPKMKLKGHPYAYLTDQYWSNKYKAYSKELGLSESEVAQSIADIRTSKATAWLSNLDAKWNLASLLFSPKTAIINMGTGNANTIINAGWESWRKAGDLKYLQTINPKWKNWKDVEAEVDLHGGIESFIKNEANLSGKFTSGNMRNFLDDVARLLKKDPNAEDASIREIAKKHGVGESIMDTAGFFMRKSERMIRRRAWIAHYLKAREILDANNFTMKWDHPWLIQMANKGVYATQFLYNGVNRPAFARTSLGKIATRFQLFAYNSIKFRSDLLRDARYYEFDKNSEATKRFERMASLDLLVMSLASLFPMSIFGAALPPPYNWASDAANFLFGNQEEKERAFFGVLPYPANIVQPVLPPSSRVLTSTLALLSSGDWDKFASYHVWTWFPFGRFINDTRKSIENPYLLPERSFGIPFNTFIRQKSKVNSNSMQPKSPIIDTLL